MNEATMLSIITAISLNESSNEITAVKITRNVDQIEIPDFIKTYLIAIEDKVPTQVDSVVNGQQEMMINENNGLVIELIPLEIIIKYWETDLTKRLLDDVETIVQMSWTTRFDEINQINGNKYYLSQFRDNMDPNIEKDTNLISRLKNLELKLAQLISLEAIAPSNLIVTSAAQFVSEPVFLEIDIENSNENNFGLSLISL